MHIFFMSFHVFFSFWAYMTHSGQLSKLCFQKQDADPPAQGGTARLQLSAGAPTEHKREAICMKNTTGASSLLPLSPWLWGVWQRHGCLPTSPRSRPGASALSLWKRRHLGGRWAGRVPPRCYTSEARRTHCAGVKRAAGSREWDWTVQERAGARNASGDGREARRRRAPTDVGGRAPRAALRKRVGLRGPARAGRRRRRRTASSGRRVGRSGEGAVPGCRLRREGLHREDGRLPVGGGGNGPERTRAARGSGGRQLRGCAQFLLSGPASWVIAVRPGPLPPRSPAGDPGAVGSPPTPCRSPPG